jgi:undecaprenyl-diphosphatase
VTTATDEQHGQLDPAVAAPSESGWRRWATQLGRDDPERIAGFGVVVGAGFVLGLVAVYSFAWLANQVLEQEATALDSAATTFVLQFRSPWLDAVMRIFSMFGSEVVYVVGGLLLVLFAGQRRWGAAFLLVLVTAGAQALNNVLKDLFRRARPEPVISLLSAQQWSFPSGHAMVSAAFYFFLAYLAWRLAVGIWRWVLVFGLLTLVLLIGISRIYLQAHYLSDVIAGYAAGFLWTDAVIVGSHLLSTRRRRTLSG